MYKAGLDEQRVLILSPRGRDAQVIADVLGQEAIGSHLVTSFDALLAAMDGGAAAAIIAEEAFVGADLGPMTAWLAAQPSWSDFPFVILLSRKLEKANGALQRVLSGLGNIILLERPLSADTLRSAGVSALRARQRQYQARAVLIDRSQVSDELIALNKTLEQRVELRTQALAEANDRLTAEVIEREKNHHAMMQYQKLESLSRLTGGVAHDFNNILSVIQNCMELLLLGKNDDKVRRRALTAKAACERGGKLTAQLLAFARNQKLDIKPLLLQPLFENVALLARPLLGSNIILTVEVDPEVDCVLADSTQMEMALLNTLINARDAMEPIEQGGRIDIRAILASPYPRLSQDADYIRISVSDNGPGMPPEVLSKVFEPFFTTKEIGKGTGLGLSQVYGMAEQSGGLARIHSAVGTGTSVEIWLKVANDLYLDDTQDLQAFSSTNGKKILLVEDDDAVREGMAEALSILGYTVSQARNGAEGLDALTKDRPDLLLADYLMPGMTGADLARTALQRFPALPVIISTGYADMEVVRQSIGNGTILRKPFKIAELNHAIVASLRDMPNRSH